MLSHRDIIRALRTALKALPEHPHACDVAAAPGTGTRTIVVRDSRGRSLLTVSALAAVYAPALPGREQRTLDELAPRPELPAVPPLAVDPTGHRKSVHGSFFDEGTGVGVGPFVGDADAPIDAGAPGFRILRVGDLVFAPDLATWTVGEIARETDGGVESVVVRLDQGGRSAVVDRAEITLDAADLWGCEKLPAVKAVETVRVWIAESEWDALTPDDRDDLEHPIGGLTIDWQGTEGWVWSRVARDEVLVTLRGVAEAHGVEIVEGEEQPAPIAKPKRAKKTARKGSLR
jgi:hypothetical protein